MYHITRLRSTTSTVVSMCITIVAGESKEYHFTRHVNLARYFSFLLISFSFLFFFIFSFPHIQFLKSVLIIPYHKLYYYPDTLFIVFLASTQLLSFYPHPTHPNYQNCSSLFFYVCKMIGDTIS